MSNCLRHFELIISTGISSKFIPSRRLEANSCSIGEHEEAVRVPPMLAFFDCHIPSQEHSVPQRINTAGNKELAVLAQGPIPFGEKDA